MTDSSTKEEQIRIERSEKRFRLIFENSPVGKSITSHDGRLNVNKQFSKIIGYSEEELNKISWKEITHPDDIEDSLKQIEKMVQSDAPVQFRKRYIRKNGHIVWTNVTSVKEFDPYTEKEFFLTSIYDVTELVEAENALKESEERFKLATTAAHNGIWDWWTDTTEVFYSEQWKAQLGYKPDELENNFATWENLLHPDDKERMIKKVQDFLANPQEFFVAEFRMMHKDGTPRWIYNRAAVKKDETGKVIRMYGAHMDITDRKETAIELEKAKKKAEIANIYKNQFLANMSHEIRTPMNGLVGFASLLREEDTDTATRNQYLDVIEGCSNQLLNLINDIIDVSKIEAGELKISKGKCNVGSMMAKLETTFNQLKTEKHKEHIEIIAKVPAVHANLTIHSDPTRLEQVMVNLIGNALKFTDQGSIKFGFNVRDNKVLFKVADTGIGMDQDKLDLIFERFQRLNAGDRAKYDGTGLGLAISKGIINLLGGEIKVESEPGKGSTFSFDIPLVLIDKPKTKKSDPQPKDMSVLNGKKILIAEDDFVNQHFLTKLFSEFKPELIFAKNGVEAVGIYKNTSDIAVVLMDLRMPIMDGFEAAEKIFEIDPDAIIIAQTAYAMAGDREKCLKSGFTDYVSKPMKKEQVLAALAKNIKD